jgi:hypothetical protein
VFPLRLRKADVAFLPVVFIVSFLEGHMLRCATKRQLRFLEYKYQELVNSGFVTFSRLTPSKVPKRAGVYVITAKFGANEQPYYVGRTKNLQQRLYNNHLMGSRTNARLKKHLVDGGECGNHGSAKQFLRKFFRVRWILQEGHRERGAVEGYVTGVLFPKYGIYEDEEH